MKNITLQIPNIVDTFENVVCETYEDAVNLATCDYGWDINNILEREEGLSLKTDNGAIIYTIMNCIMVDSGSEDYIFFKKWK